MFKKMLLTLVLAAAAGVGTLFLPQKADAQVFFPRARARLYWGPPAVRYYGGYYPPYWSGYYWGGPYWSSYRWYPY